MHSGRLERGTVLNRSAQVDAAHVEVGRLKCRSATRPRWSVSLRNTIHPLLVELDPCTEWHFD